MNPGGAQVWRIVATLAMLLTWAVASHLGSAGIGGPDFSAAVAVLPLLLAWGALLWQWRGAGWCGAGLAAAALPMVASWPVLQQNAALLYYLEHVGSLLALAALFGNTLRGPGDALITSMARAIYGGVLSDRKQRYTRQVTIAWTAFFLVNAVISTVLFWLVPVRSWSIHAHLLMGPLVVLMFLAEHLVRKRMLPPEERPSVAEVVRAYRHRMAHRVVAGQETGLGR